MLSDELEHAASVVSMGNKTGEAIGEGKPTSDIVAAAAQDVGTASELVLSLAGSSTVARSRRVAGQARKLDEAGELLDDAGATADGIATTRQPHRGMSATDEVGSAQRQEKRARLGRTAGEVVKANHTAGLAAERVVARQLIEEGNTILGSHVAVRTKKGLRVVDHLVQTPTGKILAIEVKSGGGVRTATQVLKDAELATRGGVVIGKNAPTELKNAHVVIVTVVRRVP
jgi:hypothetical protein